MTQLGEFDQVELERLRRVRECHDADRLNDRELARAVSQFGARGPRRGTVRTLRVMGLAAAASLLALGAFAASGVLKRPIVSVAPQLTVQEVAPGEQRRERSAARPAADQEEQPHAQESVPAAPPAQVPIPVPSPALSAESKRGTKVSAQQSQPALEVVNTEAASQGAGRAWTQAAEALRRGDSVAAGRALSELSRSDDAATRDAALLAQAELDLGTGDAARGRAVLSGLAERGATPFVRQRAQQILAEKN